VRLIDQEGVNQGVVSIEKARDVAHEANLDLVEVAPNANPPVCRVMDYGKFAYEKTKREKEARKHQKQIEINHRDIYVRKARRWLENEKKVKFVVRFRAREITYPELGEETLDEIAEMLEDVADIEQKPNLDGWSMTMMLAPGD
jgi:translation initiation factor IF-3